MPWMTLISDLHGRLPRIRTDSYLLLLAGDIAPDQGQREWLDGPFRDWLQALPCPAVAVLGNHDRYLHQNTLDLPWTLLRHGEAATVAGLRILGNGVIPCDRFPQIAEQQIEAGLADKACDVLLSHVAPAGILDQPSDARHVGSVSLARYLLRHSPKLCVFGHAHEARGHARRYGSYCVNATLGAGCDASGKPVRAPHEPWGLADDSWRQPADRIVVSQPPALQLTPRSDRALVTLNVGETGRQLLEITRPLMRQYAERLGADLVELQWPGDPQWLYSAKFALGTVLDHYARIAYVDADVVLRPGCVDLFSLCSPEEMGIVDELGEHAQLQHFGRESEYTLFRRAMGFPAIQIPWMFNAGVMVIPRSHRHLWDPPREPLPIAHCSEQDLLNARLLESGLPLKLLDKRANWQHWTDPGFEQAPPDAVLHWSGTEHRQRLESMRHWAGLPTEWEMDPRHVQLIETALRSGKYRRVAEIGCFRGYSSKAILAAAKAGAVDEIHLIDINVTPELRSLVGSSGLDGKVHLHEAKSVDVLPGLQVDAVIVDGDHRLEPVRQEVQIIERSQARLVIAHDTNATAVGHADCEGAAYLKTRLAQLGWRCTEDAERRPGERTERGLLIAERV